MIVRVTAHMSAPIVAHDVIHLDALLCFAHPSCRGRKITRGTRGDQIHMPELPLARIRHGGQWVYACTVERYPDTARRNREHFTKRKDEGDVAARGTTWTPSAGPERNYHLPVVTIETPECHWLAIGDRNGIRKLLRYVDHVGSHRRQGYGMVSRWEVERIVADQALVLAGADGLAARHMPRAWTNHTETSDSGRWLPPYWHPQGGERVRARALCDVRPEVIAVARRLR